MNELLDRIDDIEWLIEVINEKSQDRHEQQMKKLKGIYVLLIWIIIILAFIWNKLNFL